MKAFLLIYSDSLGSREQVIKCLDSLSIVSLWRYDLPNSFYIISNQTAKILAEKIREHFPGTSLFIVTEIIDSWGWLTQESWHIIQNKARMPKS